MKIFSKGSEPFAKKTDSYILTMLAKNMSPLTAPVETVKSNAMILTMRATPSKPLPTIMTGVVQDDDCEQFSH